MSARGRIRWVCCLKWIGTGLDDLRLTRSKDEREKAGHISCMVSC